jgi:NADPH:quinone reductase-like Zn-dependent oxidoreductase
MKAVFINEFGGRDKLIYTEDFPKPEAKEGEVLIRIKAASVNPVDYKIREGLVRSRTPIDFPAILGWDFAGFVEETGFSVSRFKKGDEVYAYARRPVIKSGTYAEYIAIPESYIALKPKTMSFEQASTIPLVGLTALQSLNKAGLKQGITLLVLAASGGVGSVAIQLGKIAGAKVIGLASSKNTEYIKSLGANGAVNYDNEEWVSKFNNTYAEKADIVFDCAGGDTLVKAYQCVKRGGTIVSITSQADKDLVSSLGINFLYHFVEPNAVDLEKLSSYIDAGKLKTEIHSVFALKDTAKAHEQSESRHTRGKIVLSI